MNLRCAASLGELHSFLPLGSPENLGVLRSVGDSGENTFLHGQGGRDLPVATCLPQPGCWGSGQVYKEKHLKHKLEMMIFCD